MSTPAKLHEDIVASSIWNEDAKTCKVWVTLIAMADERGVVFIHPGMVYHPARVTREEGLDAVRLFVERGMVVELEEGGLRLVNYLKYNGLGNMVERRARQSASPSRRAPRCSSARFHYTYRITEGALFYIGVRSSNVPPEEDVRYMGSGNWCLYFEAGVRTKEILATYPSREDANEGEAMLIAQHVSDPNCMNRTKPRIAYF